MAACCGCPAGRAHTAHRDHAAGAESDPETQARLAAFRQGLERLGWREGRNVRFDYRFPVGDFELIRKHSAELVTLGPDAMLVGITSAVEALKRLTTTIPIVFANVADPIGSGLVPSLARPGGNVTGFTAVEYPIIGKWLELLKEIAPAVKRVALLGNPDVAFSKSFLRELEIIAPKFAVKPVAADIRDAVDIERAIEAFAQESNGGLLTVPSFTASIHRALIFRLALNHRLPAVYPFRFYAADGGLASYGPDQVDQYRRAASYIDRILKGERPADLPVQAPIKFETVVNLKTARALGVTVPATLLARADEVVE
jgi:putative ABC transport system substrate-binding protein